MSNKHVNHQHGLHTMNITRPKSSLPKRANKAKAKLRKAPLLAALQEARYGKPVVKAKAAPVSRKPAKKAEKKAAQKATRKASTKTTKAPKA